MVIWVDIFLNEITMEIYFKGASTRNTDFIKTVNFYSFWTPLHENSVKDCFQKVCVLTVCLYYKTQHVEYCSISSIYSCGLTAGFLTFDIFTFKDDYISH